MMKMAEDCVDGANVVEGVGETELAHPIHDVERWHDGASGGASCSHGANVTGGGAGRVRTICGVC